MPFLDDFFHLRLDLIQILPGKRRILKIIVISGIDAGADGQFRLREHPLYRLRHHMGSRVAHHPKPFLIVCCQNIQLTVLLHRRAQIHHLPVYLSGAGRPGQALADIFRNVYHADTRFILLDAAVF